MVFAIRLIAKRMGTTPAFLLRTGLGRCGCCIPGRAHGQHEQCAAKRRHSSAGANPTRQLSLQPATVGADDGANDIVWSYFDAKGSPRAAQ